MYRVTNGVLLAFISVALLAGAGTSAQAAEGAPGVPWWKQQKLVFMWGQWGHSRADKNKPFWRADLPRHVFRNAALSGATVFVGMRWYNANDARLAHEFGLKYFPTKLQSDMPSPDLPGRFWIDEKGQQPKTKAGYTYKCPVDERVYEKWLIEPHVEGIRAGLIDGIHIDWEYYGGNGEATGICYCQDCFDKFLARQGIKAAAPKPADRVAYLKERDLVKAYADRFHQRRVDMFTSLREQLQALKADLIFSVYDLKPAPRSTVVLKAWNTPEVPLIWLDQRHYATDDTQPWWEAYSEKLKEDGCLYIPGGWTTALFGMQASQVSAARWIYEAAINEDGVWLWFERVLDDDVLRAYAQADRELKNVQSKVGKYLLQGERDPNLATAVEWTGRPELEKAVMTYGYHLNDKHLVHVNNVHSEWPLRARIRFPRLTAAKNWTVLDPLTGLYYTHNGTSAVWTTARLHAGVVIAMAPRSDHFLLIAPAQGNADISASQLMYSREFSALPEHGKAAPGDATKEQGESTPATIASGGLVYTASVPMGFEGSGGDMTLGNAIRRVDRDGQNQQRLKQLRGHLWSPSYSPDGKRIAYVHDTAGRGQVCVMNADGSGAINVSNNKYCDRTPVWSPASDKLAFVSDRDGDWSIYRMNADGSDQAKVAGNPGWDRSPTWSPDGKRIAWESHVSGMPAVWVCNVDGSNSHPLIRPDKELKVTRTNGVKSGTFPANTASGMSDNTIWLSDPVWSPDGKYIAAIDLDTAVIVSADGSSLQQMAALQSIKDLCWSPDSTKLAGVSRVHGGNYGTERSGVFFVNVNGPYWGTYICEAKPILGPRIGGAPAADTFTWYAHGSAKPRRVIKSFGGLAWSPDGKTLAFSSDMDPSGAFYVYTIPVKEKAQPTRIDSSKSAWPQQIMWRPR